MLRSEITQGQGSEGKSQLLPGHPSTRLRDNDNAHTSLEGDILCFTTERSNQRCLSAVKHQAMAMIDQDQDLYDSAPP